MSMNNQIDNATRAQVLREEVEWMKERHRGVFMDTVEKVVRDRADELDPPRPQIEPGTLCEAEHNSKVGTVCGYYGLKGLHVDKDRWWEPTVPFEIIHNIRPVRTLKPTQVAVDVPDPKGWPDDMTEIALYGANRGAILLHMGDVISRYDARRMHEEQTNE